MRSRYENVGHSGGSAYLKPCGGQFSLENPRECGGPGVRLWALVRLFADPFWVGEKLTRQSRA